MKNLHTAKFCGVGHASEWGTKHHVACRQQKGHEGLHTYGGYSWCGCGAIASSAWLRRHALKHATSCVQASPIAVPSVLHYVIGAPAKQPPGSAQRSACGQRRTPSADFPVWGARTWDATTCGACKRTQGKEEHPAALTADQCLRRIERTFAEMMR